MKVKRLQRVFGYFNTQLVKESRNVLLWRVKRYVQTFSQLCNDSIEVNSSVKFYYFNILANFGF